MLRVLAFAGAVALLLACASESPPPAPAPPPPPAETGPLAGDQLDQLVARVALYPDALLALVLPASTQPTQIVEAERFLAARQRDPKLEPSATWDDAVKSLLNYPDVIHRMNQDLAWTVKLGTAVSTQLADVMSAIQQVRTRAMAAGHLKTNEKWIVTQENGIIRIESADPDVIYIPIYDETQIYVESPSTTVITSYPPYPCYWCPGAYYGMGMMWGFGWYAGGIYWDDDDIDIDIDHDRPYRPDRPRPTPHDGAGRNQWKPKPSQPISGAGAGGAARPGTLPAQPGATRPAVGGGPATRESLTKLPSSYDPKYSGGSRKDSYGGYQRGQDAVRASDRGAQSRGASSSPSRSYGGSTPSRSYGGSSYGGYGRGSSASSWGSRGSMSRGGMGGGGMRGGGGGRGGGRR